jgi:predicted transcriptional regulator
MKTTVLGIRLDDTQREKLKQIALVNRMSEVEVGRMLINSAISGEIKIEKGHVVVGSE